MTINIDNYLTHFKAVAFGQMISALHANTCDEMSDVLAELRMLMKVIKPMGRHNIDFNMLYNDLMLAYSFAAEKLLKCAD